MTPGCGLLRMGYVKLSANGWEPGGGNVPLIVEVDDEPDTVGRTEQTHIYN